MSSPLNILSKYRSYSFYHVLAICDRTATAQALSKSTDLSVWQHPENATQDEQGIFKFKDITIPADFSNPYIQDNGTVGHYCILINGATDANFVITEAKWFATTAAEAVMGDQGTSCAVEGSLRIVEPRGILLSDQIVACCLQLGIDAQTVIWVLKTFFVGYELDGTVTYINDVTPVQFIAYDLVGTFTEAGGAYELSFVATTNGAARLPQYSKVVENISVFLGRGTDNTLSAAMSKLQENVKINYARYAKCIRNYVTDAFKDDREQQQAQLDRYFDVEYEIELDQAYQSNKYQVTDDVAQHKNTARCNDSAILKPAPGMSIESAIAQIMTLCPRVKEDMSKGAEDKVKYEYKIISSIITSISTNGKPRLVVHYQVRRFPVPKDSMLELFSPTQPTNQATVTKTDGGTTFNFSGSGQQNNLQSSGQNVTALSNENLIEFDYLYSGKNIDVLEFDIKMNLGMAYLQTATIINTYKQQLETMPKRSIHVSPKSAGGDTPTRLKKDQQTAIPIFFGTIVRDTNVTNSDDHATSSDAAYTLAKHSSLEVADVTIKILGNPRMLGSLNKATGPDGLIVSTPTQAADPAAVVFPHFTTVPTFAKLNIYMPISEDDLATFQEKSHNYKQQFWFNGYYYVYAIDIDFLDGVFTQTLHMLALPPKSIFENLKAEKGSQQFTTRFKDCYEGQATTSTPSAGAALSSGSPVPGTPSEAAVVQAVTTSPQQTKSWDKATQELQTAIVKAGAGVNIPNASTTLAQICHIESRMGTNTVPPAGSATGPFQFIKSTWLQLAKGPNSFANIGIDTTGLTDEQILALRDNANCASQAGATLLAQNAVVLNSTDPGDLYLAHFMGAGSAKHLIDAAATNPKESLSQAVGVYRATAILKNNPSLLKLNNGNEPTVAQMKKWSATQMAKASSQGVPVVRPKSQTTATTTQTPPTPASSQGRKVSDAIAKTKNVNEQKKQPDPCNKDPIVTPIKTTTGTIIGEQTVSSSGTTQTFKRG